MNLDSNWYMYIYIFFITSWGEAMYSKDRVASTQSADLVTSRLKPYVANC